VSDPVSVGVVFERFPASVRGAVVVRGQDPDPHQVTVSEASVYEAAGTRTVRDVSLEPATIELAPRGEVLVPFDVPFAGLDPGWYRVEAEVLVDGQRRFRGPQEPKRFVVPWPGEVVRRGTIDAGLRIGVPGSEGAVVDRVELKVDRAVVRWHHAPGDQGPEFGELKVLAGSRKLPVLESSHDASGGRTTITYPVLKRHASLVFELDRRHRPGKPPQRGHWSATLDLE
jgi:hypothetical protein